MNFKEISDKLKLYLETDTSPVAVKLARKETDIPEGIKELDKPMFYCGMLKYAMQGNAFFAKGDMHTCKRGAARLGLCEIPNEEMDGSFYINKASVSSARGALRFVAEAPRLDARSVIATVVAPLEKATFDPDVVVIETIPRRAFELMSASLFDTGGKFVSWLSAPYELCGFSTVRPYLHGKMNIAIACEFARMAAKSLNDKYLDEGVIVGIPGEMLETIVENYPKIGYVKKRLFPDSAKSS
jgi:uncharacterized protein (DUF169 family)